MDLLLKIAMITDNIEVGGVAAYANQLTEALRGLGHEVTRMESWHLNPRIFRDFDVVHSHTLWRLGRLRNIPLVFTGHGTLFSLFAKNISLRTRFRMYNVWTYFSAKLNRGIIQASTAVNRLAAGVIERDLGLVVDAVIRPGVDTKQFNPEVPTLELDGYPRLIFAGPITHRKNIVELIHILHKLKSIYPDASLRILGWVGANGYLEELLSLRQALNLNDAISFEFVERNMVARYIRSSDIYISASRVDWTPMSVYEAIACGTPVLLSDIESHKEMIMETRGGETYHLGDPNSALPKIQRLLANQEQLKKNSRDFLSNATWENRANRFLEVYRKAI